MSLGKGVELLKLCNTPPSIISPYPIFAVSLFLISRKDFIISDLLILFAGVVITLISNFGSNLWNHCNDIKEDQAIGKKTVLMHDISMNNLALFLATTFYACSILFAYYLSLEFKRPIYIYFLIWAFVTWWYSDDLILKKVTGFRLKEHYIGELITYCIAWPTYTLSIWLIYSDFNIKGLLISLAFLFFGVSGVLLKDLKDISGDRRTGLKTFGVVFYPSQLVRYSNYFMVLFYLAMLNPLTLNSIGTGILIMIFPFAYFLKNIFLHMHRKKWVLDAGDLKALRGIGTSIQISVVFMGLSTFI